MKIIVNNIQLFVSSDGIYYEVYWMEDKINFPSTYFATHEEAKRYRNSLPSPTAFAIEKRQYIEKMGL